MATVFQVGVGSGGIIVLDLVGRSSLIDHLILVDPDRYQARNVYRHLFGPDDAGRLKVDLAAEWIRRFRPDLRVTTLAVDLLDLRRQDEIKDAVRRCDVGVCAVDSEPAKYHFDALMRRWERPWTLGEVLSGGIGGWVHVFQPRGPCYGCVASHLQRTSETDRTPPPDYSDPAAAAAPMTIPADKAAISVIASLHAQVTLHMLAGGDPGCTSLLLTLARVEGVFPEPLRAHRLRISRSPECLICQASAGPTGEELDVALDEALARLDHE